MDELIIEFINEALKSLDEMDDSESSTLSSVTQGSNISLNEILSIGGSMKSFSPTSYSLRSTFRENKLSESLYKEITSDSDEDSIFHVQTSIINSNWINSLTIGNEFIGMIRGVKATIPIPNNTIIGLYGGIIIKKKSEIKKKLCGFPPHYVIETNPFPSPTDNTCF